ncbi:MAG: hypothetical protein CBE07_001345 [Pelagibacteraceae bacterium TMED247]|nr:MAG: hypothetical protein CBE07_001345 [Pelagibacteraceae bacterium TMED247]
MPENVGGRVRKEEIEKLAEKNGWQVETDNDGQIIIYTGVQSQSQTSLKLRARIAAAKSLRGYLNP